MVWSEDSYEIDANFILPRALETTVVVFFFLFFCRETGGPQKHRYMGKDQKGESGHGPLTSLIVHPASVVFAMGAWEIGFNLRRATVLSNTLSYLMDRGWISSLVGFCNKNNDSVDQLGLVAGDFEVGGGVDIFVQAFDEALELGDEESGNDSPCDGLGR